MRTQLSRLSVRHWSLAGLAFCVLMMAVALGLEHIVGLEPCPLCIFQRVAVLSAAAVFAVAAIHNPGGRLGAGVYGALGLAAVAGGIGVAWRHLWLQSLPADEVPSCGPGLDYMMELLPWRDVVARSEEHTSELQSRPHLVCRLLLEKKNRRGVVPLRRCHGDRGRDLVPLSLPGRDAPRRSRSRDQLEDGELARVARRHAHPRRAHQLLPLRHDVRRGCRHRALDLAAGSADARVDAHGIRASGLRSRLLPSAHRLVSCRLRAAAVVYTFSLHGALPI